MNIKVKHLLFGLITVGIILILGSTAVVFASNGDTYEAPELTQEEIFDRLNTIVDWVFTVLVITSVFIILISAFQFVAEGNNPETLTKARNRLIWAAVGIATALGAKSIPTIIINILNP